MAIYSGIFSFKDECDTFYILKYRGCEPLNAKEYIRNAINQSIFAQGVFIASELGAAFVAANKSEVGEIYLSYDGAETARYFYQLIKNGNSATVKVHDIANDFKTLFDGSIVDFLLKESF